MKREIYQNLITYARSRSDADKVVYLDDNELFTQTIALFGPQLKQEHCAISLQQIFKIGIHRASEAIIVASHPSVFSAKSIMRTELYDVNFQAIAVYMPGLGVEIANIGYVGDINNQAFVLRSESACTPSFLFGSQQCNCASQWRCTQELAAFFNSDKKSTIGFLMIHLETQNGMGMGYTPNTFSIDLCTRSHLRHAGGLVASQTHHLSMNETFTALGLPLDPRRAEDDAGYKITPIILDFLETHSAPILLSNNPMKIIGLEKLGYTPLRLKALGEITAHGALESKQRSDEFGHLDIGSELVSFDVEFQRLKKQILSIIGE
jgi:GTP cyclohydrolase II